MTTHPFLERLLDGADIEWVPLSRVARIRNGKDWKALGPGTVPVYGSGGVIGHVDTAAYTKPSVLIPRKGSITNIFYVDEPFWNVDTIYYTEVNTDFIDPKYFYYYMTTVDLMALDTGSGRPSLTQAILDRVEIPIPVAVGDTRSLVIQAEIVRILDTFTALTDELTDELTTRRKQYNYYRDLILSEAELSKSGFEWRRLGDLARNLDSRRSPITASQRIPGSTPYYGASGVVDYVDGHIFDGDYLLVSEDGANLVARTSPIAFSISGRSWVNNHAHVLEFDSYEGRRYIEFYLNSIDLSPYISGAAQPKLNKKNLNSINVPVPTPDHQARIVSVLDKFEDITSSISSGLPREIELRKKQYEYFRDLLFDFPKGAAQ